MTIWLRDNVIYIDHCKLFWPLSTHQPMGVLLIDECILCGAMSITSSATPHCARAVYTLTVML